jgi:cell wall-associated NlpC family hydrolase
LVAYFEDIEEQNKLKKILDEWLDTPFRHHCGVKGLGCDCIHFVVRIFEELGLLIDVVIPDYPKDWHLHNTRELLEEGILKNLNVEKVSLSNLMNGDIICSHFGKAASHAGIYFDGYVYQALNNIGVRKINFNDKKFRKRMRFAYRILK